MIWISRGYSDKIVYNEPSNSSAFIWQSIPIFSRIKNTSVGMVFFHPKYISPKTIVTLSQSWSFGNDGKTVGCFYPN